LTSLYVRQSDILQSKVTVFGKACKRTDLLEMFIAHLFPPLTATVTNQYRCSCKSFNCQLLSWKEHFHGPIHWKYMNICIHIAWFETYSLTINLHNSADQLNLR